MIKIACQTIIFSNSPMKNNLQEMAETVKKIGYEGIETGHGHFEGKTGFYRDLFGKLDLKLAALHTSWNYTNKDTASQLENIKSAVDAAKQMNCPYIYLSGYYYDKREKEDFISEAENFKEIGRICNGEGLTFCYHNHNWEFFNNGEGMKFLLENVPPELMKLVPDVGWLEVSGVSAVKFLKENIDRVEALHFKEFKGPGEFTELGKGIVPFKEIYDYLAGTGRDWWISAEQDRTNIDPSEAARLNYEFVSGLVKK